MNVMLDKLQNVTHGVQQGNTEDMMRTGRQGTSVHTPSSGFSVDIKGTAGTMQTYGFDDEKQKKDVQSLQNEAQVTEVALASEYLTVMGSSVTGSDLEKLSEEGFQVSNMTPEDGMNTIEHIKATLASTGTVIRGYNDDLSAEQLKEVCGNLAYAETIKEAFAANDLPMTQGNVKEVLDAAALSSTLKAPTEGETLLLLQTEAELTTQELYLASHSGSAGQVTQSYGYYAQNGTGYLAKRSEEVDLTALEGQMARVIEDAGLTENENAMEDAKWLILHGVPLTDTTLLKYAQLKEMTFPISEEDAIYAATRALADGKEAIHGAVAESENVYQKAARILEETQDITEEAVTYLETKGTKLTLKNLYQASLQLTRGAKDGAERMAEDNGAEVKQPSQGRRMLEEIRLRMSLEANVSLLKRGWKIEVTELSELVEGLKAQESQQLQAKFPQAQTLEEAASMQESYLKTQEIALQMAGYPLSITARIELQNTTLQEVDMQAKELQNAYEQANQRYETMQTQVRSDLGDSMKKAFRNVDDILSELQMDRSEDNQRAVRALAYNEMEITKAQIDRVKDVDLTLRRIEENLTPASTLKMIREGQNPLEMTLAKLEETLTQQKQADDTVDAQKYAEYLVRLEENHQISEVERAAYIGIYRLFHQVEKSDGAVIGALVHTGEEISVAGLLRQVRSLKKRGTEYQISDESGSVSAKESQAKIDAQISAAFTADPARSYAQKQVSEIWDRLTPEVLEREGFAKENWEENERPLWELADALEQEDGAEAKQNRQNERLLDETLREMRELTDIDDESVRQLIDGGVPQTMEHLLAAQALLSSNEKNALWKHRDEQKEASERFKEAFISPDTDAQEMQEASEQFVRELKAGYETQAAQVDSFEAHRGITQMLRQLSVLTEYQRNEHFVVPVETEDGFAAVHLTIRHEEGAGRVSVSAKTEAGELHAELSVSDGKIYGNITLPEGKSESSFRQKMQEYMDGVLSGSGKETSNYALYKIAKAVIYAA